MLHPECLSGCRGILEVLHKHIQRQSGVEVGWGGGVAARWGGHHGGQQRENVSSKLERWICARFKVPFLPISSQDPAGAAVHH